MEAGKRALDLGRKAIDAYRKTLMVDKVTLDDERPPPVYLLDEISDILRSCSSDLIHEIVEYTYRRLRNPSPQVKYKVLRFIKYTVAKAESAAYRKELQTYSPSIRELFNFKGYIDPIKGNGLNQAVRDAAHEAIKAIFSSDVSQPNSNFTQGRIEGFGSGELSKPYLASSYENSDFVKKKQVDTAAIRSPGIKLNDGGCHEDCKQDEERLKQDIMILNSPSQIPRRNNSSESPEDGLIDMLTAQRGLRIQPTHEILQSFLSSAKKVDAIKLAHALKTKLQYPSWQVQLKAICLLQALLLQMDASFLQAIKSIVGALQGCVQQCASSPQATLRNKAKEVLDILSASTDVSTNEGTQGADNLPATKRTNEPLFMKEPNQEANTLADLMTFSPRATGDTDHAVEFLSLQTDSSAWFQGDGAPQNSVMEDPFDGMCIHQSHELGGAHVDNLLSSGWTDVRVNPVNGHCGNVGREQVFTLSSKADSNNESQLFTGVPLDDVFTSTSIAKCTGENVTWSTSETPSESANYPTQSLGSPRKQNHDMSPMAIVDLVALQQLQGFDLYFDSGLVGNGAVGRCELGDAYFNRFGFPSKPASRIF